MPSEDTQPNEIRLNRKGNTAVPLIRASRQRGAPRGSLRSFSQRGRDSSFGGPPFRPSHASSRPPNPSVPRGTPAHDPSYSQSSTSADTRLRNPYYAAQLSPAYNARHAPLSFTRNRERSHPHDLLGPPHKVPRVYQHSLFDDSRRHSWKQDGQEFIVKPSSDCHEDTSHYENNRERIRQLQGRSQARLLYHDVSGFGTAKPPVEELLTSATSMPSILNDRPSMDSASLHDSKPFFPPPMIKPAELDVSATKVHQPRLPSQPVLHRATAPGARGLPDVQMVKTRFAGQLQPLQPQFLKPALPVHEIVSGTLEPKQSEDPLLQPRRLLAPIIKSEEGIPSASVPKEPVSSISPMKRPLEPVILFGEAGPAVSQSLARAHLALDYIPSHNSDNQSQQINFIDLTLESDDEAHVSEQLPVASRSPLCDARSRSSSSSDDSPSSAALKHGPTCNPSALAPPPRCLFVSSGALAIDRQYGMKTLGNFSRFMVEGQPLLESRQSLVEPVEERSEADTSSERAREEDASSVSTISAPSSSRRSTIKWTDVGGVTLRPNPSSHDKPRRLLTGSSYGLVEVSMRGAIELVTWKRMKQRTLTEPSERSGDLVDDACLLRTTDDKTYTVLAHARDRSQLSMLRVRGSEETVKPAFLNRPADKAATSAGASAICAMMQPGMFASGGYDHRVHLWEVPADISKSTARELQIKHSSCVQALLPVRDVSHKLATAGADCRVNIYELASERVVNTFKVSNPVYHLHNTDTPYAILLEVAHRELQFEVRDYRLVPEKPVQRFGFDTEFLQGRYAKGDIHNLLFACGDRQGNVRLWDIRKSDKPLSIVNYFPGRRIIQVAFHMQELIACSDDFQVKFIS